MEVIVRVGLLGHSDKTKSESVVLNMWNNVRSIAGWCWNGKLKTLCRFLHVYSHRFWGFIRFNTWKVFFQNPLNSQLFDVSLRSLSHYRFYRNAVTYGAVYGNKFDIFRAKSHLFQKFEHFFIQNICGIFCYLQGSLFVAHILCIYLLFSLHLRKI